MHMHPWARWVLPMSRVKANILVCMPGASQQQLLALLSACMSASLYCHYHYMMISICTHLLLVNQWNNNHRINNWGQYFTRFLLENTLSREITCVSLDARFHTHLLMTSLHIWMFEICFVCWHVWAWFVSLIKSEFIFSKQGLETSIPFNSFSLSFSMVEWPLGHMTARITWQKLKKDEGDILNLCSGLTS